MSLLLPDNKLITPQAQQPQKTNPIVIQGVTAIPLFQNRKKFEKEMDARLKDLRGKLLEQYDEVVKKIKNNLKGQGQMPMPEAAKPPEAQGIEVAQK